MIEYILPFLAGACLGACVIYITFCRIGISANVVQQTLVILTTLYTHLTDDGTLDASERAELAGQVEHLIQQLRDDIMVVPLVGTWIKTKR